MEIAVMALGAAIIVAGIVLWVLGQFGDTKITLPKLLNVDVSIPGTLVLVIVGVGVFLFPVSPWWPGTEQGPEVEPVGNETEEAPPGIRLLSQAKVDATATSTLTGVPEQGLFYLPSHTLDGDLTTAWSEGVAGQGLGEAITFRFAHPVTLRRIDLINGYTKSPDLFLENSRLRDATVRTGDGTFRVTMRDTMNVQRVTRAFGRTSFVTIEIRTTYPGSLYEDTLLSEARFWISREDG